MKNFLPIIYLFALLAFSCETTIDVDIPREDSRLVVNAILEADSSVRLHLSSSRFSLDNEPIQPVKSAEIILLEDGQQVAVLEENNPGTDGEEGWYQSPYTPKAGHSYSIRATKAGYQTVEAETFIRPAVGISDMEYELVEFEEVYELDGIPTVYKYSELRDITLLIDDPAGEDNYYEVLIMQDAVHYLRDFTGPEPVIVDTVRVISNVYLTSDDPLLTEGGILDGDGSFYGSSLTFSDETFDGNSYPLRFNASGSGFGSNGEGTQRFIIFLRSLHREQYLYFKSLELQNQTQGNPFAEPVPVYNNIIGGYGIFSGFSHTAEIIEMED